MMSSLFSSYNAAPAEVEAAGRELLRPSSFVLLHILEFLGDLLDFVFVACHILRELLDLCAMSHGDILDCFRLGIQLRDQSRPLLRERASERIHQEKLVGHSDLMPPLNRGLVARREARPQNSFRITQREELPIDGRDHFWSSVGTNHIGDSTCTKDTGGQGPR